MCMIEVDEICRLLAEQHMALCLSFHTGRWELCVEWWERAAMLAPPL